jgi:hypothetical protein
MLRDYGGNNNNNNNNNNNGFVIFYLTVLSTDEEITECLRSSRTHDLFISLYLHFITWQPCVSTDMRERRAFSLLVVCCATLTMTDASNYSIQERLVASVYMQA